MTPSTEKHLYFFGLVPPTEIAVAVREVRLQFGDKGKELDASLEPHLTLAIPFEVNCANEVLIQTVRQGLEQVDPFTIRATEPATFLHNVWYLGVSPHEPLVALRARLLESLAALHAQYVRESYEFRPHVTILGNLSDEEMLLGKTFMGKTNFPDTPWNVTAVMLFEKVGSMWRRSIELPLKGSHVSN